MQVPESFSQKLKMRSEIKDLIVRAIAQFFNYNHCGEYYDLDPRGVQVQYCNGERFKQQMIVGKE
jgi:hypothetical protein